jgi:hypothetical protein
MESEIGWIGRAEPLATNRGFTSHGEQAVQMTPGVLLFAGSATTARRTEDGSLP